VTDASRLPGIDPAAAPEEVRPTFDAYVRERGKVPNLFRVAANHPGITAKLAALQAAVMEPGEVSVLLKELLATRVSHINLCDY
jgi:alkylhydroperoxidase family enzyme